ncbi:MAG: hypothetical protein V1777_02945 [Candidatus Micrarchaeota archaeon]
MLPKSKNGIETFLILLLIIFFSGCLFSSEDQIQARFACLGLSSQAFAWVPDCGNQFQCFQKAHGQLFDFEYSVLSLESRQAIDRYQNSLAKSWLFFNKSRDDLKKLQEACGSLEDFSQWPSLVNQINQDLANAFLASDESGQNAFAVVLVLKNELQEDQIGQIKEEKIFADWIELQENANAFQSHSASNPQSLAGRLFSAQQRMANMTEQYGIGPKLVSSQNLMGVLPQHKKEILDQLPKTNPFFPVIGSMAIDLARTISQGQLAGNSIASLQTFPVYSFFEVFSEINGTDHSIAKELSGMVSDTVQNKSELIGQNQKTKNRIEKALGETEQRLSELQSRQNGFESKTDFFALLKQLPLQTGFAPQGFSVNDVSNAIPKLSEKRGELYRDFIRLQLDAATGKITLGRQTKTLKEMEQRQASLNDNIDFIQNRLGNGLSALCAERLQAITASLKKINPDSDTKIELVAKTRFFIGEFKKSTAVLEQLSDCSQAIKSFNSLQLFDQNQAAFVAKQNSELGGCRSFLKTVFEKNPPELSDLQIQWDQFVQNQANMSIEDARNRCNQLQSATAQRVMQSPDFVQLVQAFGSARTYYSGIQKLNFYLKTQVPTAEIQNRLEKLSEFFPNNVAAVEKIAGNETDILHNADLFLSLSKQRFSEALSDALAETVEIQSASEQVVIANQAQNTLHQIVFFNPTTIAWNEPILVEIPGEFLNSVLLEKSPNIEGVQSQDKKLRIRFSAVPPGVSQATVQSEFWPTTTEEDEFFRPAEYFVWSQKKIFIQLPSQIGRLQIQTNLGQLPVNSVVVLFHRTEIPFDLQGQSIRFELQNVSPNEFATVFFGVQNPVLVQLETTADETGIRMRGTVQNRLAAKLEKIQINIPMPGGFFENITAELDGKKISVQDFSGQSQIEIPALEPKQTATLQVAAATDNAALAVEAVFNQTKQTLEQIALDPNPKIKNQAEELLVQLLKISDFSNSTAAKTIFEISRKTQDMLALQKQNGFSSDQYLQAAENAQNRIGELQNRTVSELKKEGYANAAKMIEAQIREAQSWLVQGELAFESHNYNSAVVLALKAVNALNTANAKISAEFDASLKELQKKADQALVQLQKKPSAETVQTQKTVSDSLSRLKLAMNAGNPSEILAALNETKQAIANAEQQASEQIALQVQDQKKLAADILKQLDSATLQNRIQKLAKEAGQFDSAELVKTGIWLTLSKTELEKLQADLEKLFSKKDQSQLKLFLDSNNLDSNTNKIIEAFQAQFSKKLGQFGQIKSQIDDFESNLKQNAGIELEKAKALAEQNGLNSSQTKSLFEADQAFQNEEYLTGWYYAKKITLAGKNNATGFFSLPAGIPAVIYPIIGVILIGGILKLRKKKNSEEETKKPAKIKIERVKTDI